MVLVGIGIGFGIYVGLDNQNFCKVAMSKSKFLEHKTLEHLQFFRHVIQKFYGHMSSNIWDMNKSDLPSNLALAIGR